MEKETVQEIVGTWPADLSGQELVSKIVQLLTTARQETYRQILEDGLNDTRTHPEWIAFLERGAGVAGGKNE